MNYYYYQYSPTSLDSASLYPNNSATATSTTSSSSPTSSISSYKTSSTSASSPPSSSFSTSPHHSTILVSSSSSSPSKPYSAMFVPSSDLLSSGSPTSPSSSSSPSQARRFEASRGFDLEDDLEFCPALATIPDYAYHTISSSPKTTSPSLLYQVNSTTCMHTGTTYYPPTPSSSSSPNSLPSSSWPSPQLRHQKHLGGVSNRVRRGIEIVDPSTGLRVASPPLTPAGLVGGCGAKIRV